jgi:ribosomal protein S18 acetylase RimI-like enzyme
LARLPVVAQCLWWPVRYRALLVTAPSGGAAPAQRQIRTADLDERAPIAAALAEAFFDDPVMAWILDDEASRVRRLTGMFDVLLRGHYLPLGTVWTTPDHLGAALWAPPGKAIIPGPTVLRHAPRLLRALGRRAFLALRSLSHVEQHHPKEPHWYLGVLGTRPANQGTGVGSALLAPVLRRCDEEGARAYLESSKESNIAFYRRHGFELAGEIKLPLGGPTVWPMWRDPRPPPAGA